MLLPLLSPNDDLITERNALFAGYKKQNTDGKY